MQRYDDRFLFSVIMAVYQVKEYLDEAVNSLIRQTIGFDRIQIILVDDGSTDGSGELCDEYEKRYPNQVKVIHKENGGAASARNAGLSYAEGKYISFFDPDDILGHDALKEIYRFFEQNEKTDVCCIPIFFFGDKQGKHPLNYKFEQGTRTIDLLQDENASCILLSGASSFFRTQAVRSIRFDTRLYQAEDSKFILQTLMNNPKLGIVSTVRYHYRRYAGSTLAKSQDQIRAYTECLCLFSEWALNTAEEKYGYIPKFIQHTVMYDLQWKFKQKKIPDGVLSEEEMDRYTDLLCSLIRRIDDDVILQQRNLSKPQIIFALGKKYGCLPELRLCDGQDIDICYGEKTVTKVSKMGTGLEFVSIDEKGQCVLEGFFMAYGGIEKEEVDPYVIVNGEAYPCEKVDRSTKVSIALGEEIAWWKGFRATIPLKDREPVTICPAVRIRQTTIVRKVTSYGQFAPLSSVYKHMRVYMSDYMLKMKDGRLIISAYPSWINRFSSECVLLAEILRKKRQGKGKAALGRMYYHAAKLFKRRQLWIVSDRIMKADDNGEALFIYLMKNRPAQTRVIFAISKKSEDARRLARIGPCVDAMSYRHKLLHLLCDVNVSAQADAATINPFLNHFEALRDLLSYHYFVFLQHGVIKDDLSVWLSRYNKNISGFVVSAHPEYQSVLNSNYSYSPEKIWLTGLPRFDRLYNQEEKKITLMPTWRKYLMASIDKKTGRWKPVSDFTDKPFYQFYHSLLNSDRLLSALEKYGYKLQFFPHPNIRLGGIEFDHDPRVTVLPTDTFYRDIYAESKLIITDYSSAVFDFVYLRKPVLYCHFDKEGFFAGEHVYTKGYFDYERDGFGEVTYDLESTIDQIIDYASHDCVLKEEYRRRIDGFFAFNDRDNCRRVTERILQLKNIQ